MTAALPTRAAKGAPGGGVLPGPFRVGLVAIIACASFFVGCGASGGTSPPVDASTSPTDGGAAVDSDAGAVDADASLEEDGAADASDASAALDANATTTDGNVDASDGEAGLAPDRFVTGVVSFTPGPCSGFGVSSMPGVVEGPPHGGGASTGSLDVVSLGVGGEIVVSFAPNTIVDGPGVDFIVFENPFDIGGNPQDPYAEPGEVSVSEDGTTWATYPCTATSYPYGQCAGWHVVYSAPGNGISPVDPSAAGGDQYDLADLGLTEVRFVLIRDKSNEVCPDAGGPTSDGFDLDAISIVHASIP